MTKESSKLHQESMKDEVNKEIIYNEWAHTYEDYVNNLKYIGPISLCKQLYNYIDISKMSNIKILDFGCGTGLLGKEIKHKFNNLKFTLDGIDISEEMIRVCKSKNIYNNIWKKNLFTEKLSLSKLNYYDIIISCGVFLEGHVSFDMVDILLNYTKISGILVFTFRESFKKKNLSKFNKYITLNPRLEIRHECNVEYLPQVGCKMILAKKLY